MGNQVLATNLLNGDKWVPGVIVERKGPLSYIVQIRTGAQWRRHNDQLRDGSEIKEGDWNKVHQDGSTGKQSEAVQVPAHPCKQSEAVQVSTRSVSMLPSKNTYPVPALSWTDKRCYSLYWIWLEGTRNVIVNLHFGFKK